MLWMNKENKMGTMPISKLVVTMSLPIMISMLVQSLYNIVDSIFVAKISEGALTATSIAYSAQILQIAVAVGTGVGVNALVSRMLGAKHYDKVNEAATTGLMLTLLSSFIFVLWGIFGSKAFISQFTNDSHIIMMGSSYLRICQIFCTGIFLGTLTQRLLQATGRTFSSMVAQLVGALVNLVLDPILIFGYFGLTPLGIEGAAIATVIGQWSAAIIGIILNIVQNKEIHFVFKNYHFDKNNVIEIYKVGLPTILTQGFGSIMVAAINAILIMFSSTAVAFFGVYFKLQSFLFMPMNGLGQGCLPIVGFNYGAKNVERVLKTWDTVKKIAIGLSLIGMVVFILCPQILLNLFSASDAMKAIGVPALRIISISFVFASLTMVIGYFVSGLGNGMVNMLATALRQLIILLPCVLLFGYFGGIHMVWFAFWISEVSAFGYAYYSLKKELLKKLEIKV